MQMFADLAETAPEQAKWRPGGQTGVINFVMRTKWHPTAEQYEKLTKLEDRFMLSFDEQEYLEAIEKLTLPELKWFLPGFDYASKMARLNFRCFKEFCIERYGAAAVRPHEWYDDPDATD